MDTRYLSNITRSVDTISKQSTHTEYGQNLALELGVHTEDILYGLISCRHHAAVVA
jgi:hypothetical protein